MHFYILYLHMGKTKMFYCFNKCEKPQYEPPRISKTQWIYVETQRFLSIHSSISPSCWSLSPVHRAWRQEIHPGQVATTLHGTHTVRSRKLVYPEKTHKIFLFTHFLRVRPSEIVWTELICPAYVTLALDCRKRLLCSLGEPHSQIIRAQRPFFCSFFCSAITAAVVAVPSFVMSKENVTFLKWEQLMTCWLI